MKTIRGKGQQKMVSDPIFSFDWLLPNTRPPHNLYIKGEVFFHRENRNVLFSFPFLISPDFFRVLLLPEGIPI
jgi:hypothetical protein